MGEGLRRGLASLCLCIKKVTGGHVEGTRQAAGRQVVRADLGPVPWELDISRWV